MFVAILQSGVLNRLYKQWSDDKPIFKDMLVNIVAHIFTNKLVPIYAYDNQDDLTEAPVLKNMPEEVEKVVNEYNYTVDNLLISYLQLAVPNHQIQNRVFALSGKGSEHTSVFSMDVVSSLDDGLAIDESFVPALSLNRKDHRGRRILRNSYAYDYWKRGDPRQLTESNKLMISEIWYLINDFNKVLSSIHEALASMAKPTDKLLEIVGEMAYEFDYKFKRGFGMKVREEEI
uniref:Uncharacterized protein n=1 Tax=Ditylenchus dipsaci TaxID=166011 RepID=A0A915DT54_9BILA